MRVIRWLLLVAACAQAATYHSYAGNDPALWTRHSEAQLPVAANSEYTVFLGSPNGYHLSQIVTDAAGNTYVAGDRYFPVFGSTGFITDVFVAKLDPSGNVLFMTALSGKNTDHATSIALDRGGNVYLGGYTNSANFPLRNPLQPKVAGQSGFIVKLAPDGTLLYSTYFGGAFGGSVLNAIALDPAGNPYAAGLTSSPEFPQSEGFPKAQLSNGPGAVSGGFIAKIAPAGDRILFSAVLAGTSPTCSGVSSCLLSARSTSVTAIALDPAGNVYFTGTTNTWNVPTTANALLKQGTGGFVGRINAAWTGLDYLTYLSAAVAGVQPYVTGATSITGLAVDETGNAYVAGSTSDSKFPVTAGALQTALAVEAQPADPSRPTTDAFAAKLAPDGSKLVWATYLGKSLNDAARAIALDASGNVWLAGSTDSADFPNANGWTEGGDFLVRLNATGSALPYSALYPSGTVSQSLVLDSGGLLHAAGPNGTVSALVPAQAPSRRIFAIMNAAGGMAGGYMAPAEVVSIFGPNIGPATPVRATVENGRLPTTLGGLELAVNGSSLPLLFVSDHQINAVVPLGAAGVDSATLTLFSGGSAVAEFKTVIGDNSPGIFRQAGNNAAAINQDGTVNSVVNPARYGSIVAIWVNGVGVGYPAPLNGEIQAVAQDYSCCTAQMENQPVEVLYGGAAPGMVAGISQVNFRLPAQLRAGVKATVTITSGRRSDSADVYVVP